MGEYRDVLTKLKREHPEMFENMKDEKTEDPVWAMNMRENTGVFSREGEFMQRLEEAMQKDLEMHEV